MQPTYFKDIDLNDDFFISLKEDYPEFSKWFAKKSEQQAFVHKNDKNLIDGFLYLKIESEEINILTNDNKQICLPAIRRLKVGTFKINPHGTKLGERFVRQLLKYAVDNKVEEIYVTIFDKHQGLINLTKKFDFQLQGRSTKVSGINGQEGFYFRKV